MWFNPSGRNMWKVSKLSLESCCCSVNQLEVFNQHKSRHHPHISLSLLTKVFLVWQIIFCCAVSQQGLVSWLSFDSNGSQFTALILINTFFWHAVLKATITRNQAFTCCAGWCSSCERDGNSNSLRGHIFKSTKSPTETETFKYISSEQ